MALESQMTASVQMIASRNMIVSSSLPLRTVRPIKSDHFVTCPRSKLVRLEFEKNIRGKDGETKPNRRLGAREHMLS